MDNQKRFSLALILCAVLAALLLYPAAFGSLSLLSFTSGGGTSVTGAAQLSPQRIDAVLCAAHSPACGTGAAFYSYGLKYKINDAYALATFHHESSYGLAGVARSSLAIGNIRCTSGYSCYSGYRSYATWASGIEDFYSLIRSLYVNSWHLSTVEQIIPKYAPAGDNNEPASYISSVISDMNSFKN